MKKSTQRKIENLINEIRNMSPGLEYKLLKVGEKPVAQWLIENNFAKINSARGKDYLVRAD